MSECNINYVFEVNGNKMEVTVFPNLVSETLNIVFIDLNDTIEGFIAVVDILGRRHRLFHMSGNQLQADLGSLPLGIYQLLFLTKGGIQFHIGNISKI